MRNRAWIAALALACAGADARGGWHCVLKPAETVTDWQFLGYYAPDAEIVLRNLEDWPRERCARQEEGETHGLAWQSKWYGGADGGACLAVALTTAVINTGNDREAPPEHYWLNHETGAVWKQSSEDGRWQGERGYSAAYALTELVHVRPDGDCPAFPFKAAAAPAGLRTAINQ